MKKIDKKLFDFVVLSERECNFECLVYYLNRDKTLLFFQQNDIKVINDFKFLNAFVVCFNSQKILKTASQSFVQYISSVSEVSALMDVSRKILNVNNCDLSGKNITIAFIDTGINKHLDFVLEHNRIVKFCDFVNSATQPYDDNGHGTFISGVACGSGLVSFGKYRGIAYKSNIVSLKALNEKGEANAVKILEAMEWIFDNYKTYGIRVVCMSFGSEPLGYNDPIMKGAERLWNEGIVVVCAGGNSGPEWETIKSPGISKQIITVGGLDDKRNDVGEFDEKEFEVANFSSRGPALNKVKPDIIAPSVNICSCSSMGGYKTMSGTSVATPMVAGLCSLLLEKYPYAKPFEIKKYLQLNAKTINWSKNAEGYGVAKFD